MLGSIKNEKLLGRKRKLGDENGSSNEYGYQNSQVIAHADTLSRSKRQKIMHKDTLWGKCVHYVSKKLYAFISQSGFLPATYPVSAPLNSLEPLNLEKDNMVQPVQSPLSLQQKIVWAHGSSSATLVGLSFSDHKLYSSGQMMQLFVEQGIMPFAGTFDGGSSLAGVNQAGLSGVTHKTAYRFLDAWRYANKGFDQTSVAISTDSLLDVLIEAFGKIQSSKVIREELISQYCRAIGRLKIWDKNQLMQWVHYKRNLKYIKKAHQTIFTVVKAFQSKLDRAVSLLGSESKLKLFLGQVESRLKNFKQHDHENLVGKHRFGFIASAQDYLIDVIYLLMRQRRLIYTPKDRKTTENILYQAGALYSFGGWPASALANSITASDATFEAQYIAVLTGHIVTHSESVRKILGRENVPGDPDRYSPQTMHSELVQLENRLDRYQAYINASLDFEHKVVSYTQTQKDLTSLQLPILFCATKMHVNMRDAKHESIWASENGIALGSGGIDVLLTDTVAHQSLIESYLIDQHLDTEVSVGVYKV